MPSSVETAPPREDLPTLFCTECGGGIQQRWTFCAFCGHRCREDGRAVGLGPTDTKTNKGHPPGATADHLVDGHEGDQRGKSNAKLNDTDNSGVNEEDVKRSSEQENDGGVTTVGKHAREPTPRSPLDSYKAFRDEPAEGNNSQCKMCSTTTVVTTAATTMTMQRNTGNRHASGGSAGSESAHEDDESEDEERHIKSIIKNKFSADAPAVARAGDTRHNKIDVKNPPGNDMSVSGVPPGTSRSATLEKGANAHEHATAADESFARRNSSTKRIFREAVSAGSEDPGPSTADEGGDTAKKRRAMADEQHPDRGQHGNRHVADDNVNAVDDVPAALWPKESFLTESGRRLSQVLQVELEGMDARGIFERVYQAEEFIGQYYNKDDFDIRISRWKPIQYVSSGSRNENTREEGYSTLPPRKRVNAKLARTIELRGRSDASNAKSGNRQATDVVQVEHQQVEFLMQGRAMRVEMTVHLPK